MAEKDDGVWGGDDGLDAIVKDEQSSVAELLRCRRGIIRMKYVCYISWQSHATPCAIGAGLASCDFSSPSKPNVRAVRSTIGNLMVLVVPMAASSCCRR